LNVWIVLYDDGVLDVAARWCWSAVLIGIVVGRARHAAAVEEDLEGRAEMSSAWLHMHAVLVAVEALGEDHAVERPIELDVDAHVRLLALHLKVLDLRIVGGGSQRPRIVSATM